MKYDKHKTSEVQTKVVGEGTQIWQYCIVLKGAKIGRKCNINCHCFIENDVILGDNVTIKSGVYLWDGVRVEDDVFVGPNVTFTNDKRPRSKKYPASFDRTILRKGCSIGAGAVILGGVSIGEYAMIGAGSVVTKDVPAYNLWFGNPARFHSYVCRCGNKLTKKLCCGSCGKKFKSTKGNIQLA